MQERYTETPPTVFAANVLGEAVGCLGADELGRIVDLVLDGNTGRTRYAIVSTAELLGREPGELLAVPWRALTIGHSYADNRAFYQVRLPLRYMKRAPGFLAGSRPDFSSSRAMAEVHSFYGEPP